MQVLNTLQIKNMFSHTDTSIIFEPGLNYITGAEGKGKSLVLESIGFAWFGSVALRGVATQYKKTEVILTFTYLNFFYKVNRKINDAILSIKDEKNNWVQVALGTTPVNQKIISLFGYDFSIFSLSNYCQQGELSQFSKLTPAKKIAFIEKVSGIEEAKEFSKFIDTRRKDLRVEINAASKYSLQPLCPSDLDPTKNYKQLYEECLQKQKECLTLQNTVMQLQAAYDNFKEVPKLYKDNIFTGNPANTLQDVVALKDTYLKYRELCLLSESIQDQLSALSVPREYKDFNFEYFKDNLPRLLNDLQIVKQILRKKELLKAPHIDCSHCGTTINIQYKQLEQFKDIPDQIITLPLDSTFNSLTDLETYYNKLDKFFTSSYDQYKKCITNLNEVKIQLKEFDSAYLDTLSHRLFLETEDILSTKEKYQQDVLLAQEEKLVLLKNLETNKALLASSDFLSLQQESQMHLKNSLDLEIYLTQLSLYETSVANIKVFTEELNYLTALSKKVQEFTERIQAEALPLINFHASVLLNSMTNSVLKTLVVSDSYDLLVDGKSISVCSGSEKDTASLAFRLSLGKSIILGMLPLFIGDEIDAACKSERSMLITDVLNNIESSGYQVLLVTHKDVSELENCNIIDLGN